MAEIQVIGGGFSGLAASYFLACKGHRIRLVEKEPRIGGLLGTVQTPYGPVETAANAMIANAVVESAAADLGLTLVPAQRSARRRYIFRGGRLRRWPLQLMSTLRLVGVALPVRFGSLSRAAALAPKPRETVADWGERVLGPEATRFLLAPALSGIYASGPADLSASLTVGKLFATREAPRFQKGKLKGSVAPLEGMGAWAPAFRHTIVANGGRIVNEALPGMPTVVALPAPAAAAFLGNKAPALTAELRKIKMVPLVTATLFFAPETAPIPGFGCLFPRGEGFRTLGVLANDQIFPGRARDSISETWILGGKDDPGILELSDSQMIELIAKERAKLHGLKGRLLFHRITRWPEAVPLYSTALEEAAENLRTLEYREGIHRVFGTYLGDLGLGQVLYRASELAKEYP
jgi:oxygen-dependent protoporphyrinogen oxidase